MGNVHGRVDGMDASSAALLMGSHYVIYSSRLLFSSFFILHDLTG